MFNIDLINHESAVRIINFRDAITHQLTPETVAELLEEEGCLESIQMADIESSAFGQFKEDQCDAMLEAISTTRTRIGQTMRAFIRALNQKLSGTDITAGNDTAGEAEDGTKSIGGANIGRVRRVAGFAIMPAMIPLSDGQKVTIMFHSPSGDQNRIMPTDVLVAFQFLLNKKDVTHIVAPMGGRDMSLAQVTMTLSNIIQRNSAKFQRTQKRQQRMKSDLASAQQELTATSGEEQKLQGELQTTGSEATTLQSQLTGLRVSIEQQQDYNTELRDRIIALNEKATSKTSSGEDDKSEGDSAATSATVPLSSIQTGAMWPTLKKASVSGSNAVWYTQSNAFDIKASASITVGDSKPSEGAKLLHAQFKAARAAGYEFTHFRISGLQGIYVFVKDDQVLTKTGAASLVSAESEVSPPVTDPEPPVEKDTAKGRYRYALVNRPASLGTVPPGFAEVLPRPQESDPYFSYARNGIVIYEKRLSDEEAANFELLYLPEAEEFDDLAKSFVSETLASYASQYLEMAQEDVDTFKKTVRIRFKKAMPGVAYPQGDAENVFLASVISALTELTAEASNDDQLGKESEADMAANKAIEYLKSVVVMDSSDMQEVRAARGSVREAIATLQAASRFEDNEDLVNQAAQRLSDLLVTIQRAGAGEAA